MAVRWPDGSYTGSVRADLVPTPVEPEPETKEPTEKSDDKKKESDHGTR